MLIYFIKKYHIYSCKNKIILYYILIFTFRYLHIAEGGVDGGRECGHVAGRMESVWLPLHDW